MAEWVILGAARVELGRVLAPTWTAAEQQAAQRWGPAVQRVQSRVSWQLDEDSRATEARTRALRGE